MVANWVKSMTENVLGGPPFSVGDVVKHPSGRMVKILSGQYWGEHGLSNFWYWREVNHEGEEIGPQEHGYGWTPT